MNEQIIEDFKHVFNEEFDNIYFAPGRINLIGEHTDYNGGVLGSRMTGTGFSGCTISIVRNDKIESFKKNITGGYKKKVGYNPTFYIVEIGAGVRKLK